MKKSDKAADENPTILGASSCDLEASDSFQLCESHLSSQRICNRFPAAKLNERTVTSILQRAGVQNIRNKGYEINSATAAIVAFYKAGYESRDVAGESDRARKNRADADKAELNAIKAAGETCLISAAKMFASETRITLRGVIERANYLTKEQRDKLIKACRETKIDLPEAEE